VSRRQKLSPVENGRHSPGGDCDAEPAAFGPSQMSAFAVEPRTPEIATVQKHRLQLRRAFPNFLEAGAGLGVEAAPFVLVASQSNETTFQLADTPGNSRRLSTHGTTVRKTFRAGRGLTGTDLIVVAALRSLEAIHLFRRIPGSRRLVSSFKRNQKSRTVPTRGATSAAPTTARFVPPQPAPTSSRARSGAGSSSAADLGRVQTYRRHPRQIELQRAAAGAGLLPRATRLALGQRGTGPRQARKPQARTLLS
jgi:hypothetical protein